MFSPGDDHHDDGDDDEGDDGDDDLLCKGDHKAPDQDGHDAE